MPGSTNVQVQDRPAFKTVEVTKAVEPNVDLGNLLIEDFDPFDNDQYKSNGDGYLRGIARNNAQFLVNKLWQLPTKRVEDVIVATLPKPTTLLPREKQIPKPKPLTKWEKYAKMKGVTKRKKGRMVWDEQSQSYKPRWGYKRANNAEDDWLIEIPDQKNPYQDYYGERKEAKKERVAKNELQRLRNIASSRGHNEDTITGIGLRVENKSSKQVAQQLGRAKYATASLGQFTEKLPKEKPAREPGKKRKFSPNEGVSKMEKDKSLDIWQRMERKKPKLDIEKAVATKVRGKKNNFHDDDDDDEIEKPRSRKGGAKGKGAGGGKKGGAKGKNVGGGKKSKGSKRMGKLHSLNKKKNSKKNKR